MSDKKRYVRVVLEGYAEETSPPGKLAIGKLGDTRNFINPNSKHVKSIEDIPEPEDFHRGDIVKSASGFLYQKTSAGWNYLSGAPASSIHQRDELHPPRPLTLLVRDGKVVK